MDYEEYMSLHKSRKKPSFKFFNKVKPWQAGILIVIIFTGIRLYNLNKDNLNTVLLVGGAAIFLYILSVMKSPTEKQIIPRHIAQRLALEDLKRDIGEHGSYPQGTKIYPTSFCTLRKVGESSEVFSIKWWVGFKLSIPGKGEKEIVVKLNPYTGDIIGVNEMIMGFTGTEKETRDVLYVFPETFVKEEKKEKS